MQQVSCAKISTPQAPGTESGSRGEKSMYKFHEENNQSATSLRNNNQHAASFTNKKSARNKFHVIVYPSYVKMTIIKNV